MSLPRKPAPEKDDTSFWDARRGRIFSNRGGWVIGEAVYNCGYSLLDELVGEVSYFQLLILNGLGRLPERRLADWLEAVFACLSWPDARIWCNQIGSLAGTLRATPVAATCAGILAADSSLYGPATGIEATRFIVEAVRQKKDGKTVPEIVAAQKRRPAAKPVIVGYARPLATGDNRIPAMERVAKQLGFEVGEHLALAYEIERHLWSHYRESMNIAGYIAAFLSDQGIAATEMYRFCSTLVQAGVLSTYVEAAEQPPESFFPLRCDDLEYRGVPSRPLPARAVAG